MNIWLNRAYSTNYWVLDLLRANPDNVPVRLHVTHGDAASPVLQNADVAELEPSLEGDAYVDWALDFCRRHSIDVFVPRLGMLAISRRLDDFAALGVAVLSSNPESVAILEDKEETYRTAAEMGIAVPPWRVASSSEGLLEAHASLREELRAGELVCIKPTVGVGGNGFRVLRDNPPSVAGLLAPPNFDASLSDVVAAFRRAEDAGNEVPTFMLLPYLAEPEVSVDCLSLDGRLVSGVPRSKDGRKRSLDATPEVLSLVKRLVSAYRLSYLSNTQVRMWRGAPVLLETNTRISGGLYQAALAGVNMPWYAVKLAATGHVEVPPARLGASFVTVPMMLPLERTPSPVVLPEPITR